MTAEQQQKVAAWPGFEKQRGAASFAKQHVPLDLRFERQEGYLSCLFCTLDTSAALVVVTNCLHCEWQF